MNISETNIRQKNKNYDYYTCLFACPLFSQIGAIAVWSLNCITIPRTVAHQAPLSMEFSRQDYWSGSPFPFLGDLPDAGIESRSPALQADSSQSNQPGKAMSYNTFPN